MRIEYRNIQPKTILYDVEKSYYEETYTIRGLPVQLFFFQTFFQRKKIQKRWDQKTSSQRPNCNCNLATKKLSGVSNPILKKKCFIIYIYWRSALIYQLSSEFPFSDDGSSFGTHRLKCTQGQGLRQDFKTPGATMY